MRDATAEAKGNSNIAVESGDIKNTCIPETTRVAKKTIKKPKKDTHVIYLTMQDSDSEINEDFCDNIALNSLKQTLARPIYVIQEHHASRLHWALRFEIDGVLKSWALPKGAPDGNERRLAIQVPDHPIEYASFEGTIPKGNYGAGAVTIWDKGTFELESMKPDKILVGIKGQKLKGRYCLIHFKPHEKNWLFFKTK